MSEYRWPIWLRLFVGIYVFATPLIVPWALPSLAISDVIVVSHVAFGLFITMVSWLSLAFPKNWQAIIQIGAGSWLVVCPWLLRFHEETFVSYSNVAAGATIFLLAVFSIATGALTQDHEHF
ncbi:SPW repeat protein [Rhizobium sp. CF142]|nr:SPW repeat protein [Rhizobium sp. CF142]